MGLQQITLLTAEEVTQHKLLIEDLQARMARKPGGPEALQIKHLQSELDEHNRNLTLKRKVF